jgi:hypothetical protein
MHSASTLKSSVEPILICTNGASGDLNFPFADKPNITQRKRFFRIHPAITEERSSGRRCRFENRFRASGTSAASLGPRGRAIELLGTSQLLISRVHPSNETLLIGNLEQ